MPGGRTSEAKLLARTAVNLQHEFEVKECRYLTFPLIQEEPNTKRKAQTDSHISIT